MQALLDAPALAAAEAGALVRARLAVEGLGQAQGEGALAHVGRPDQEVGMGQPALPQGGGQGPHRPPLADEAPVPHSGGQSSQRSRSS